ncbi:hypothetical protein RIF29_28659 [Crotalaria pallida]|uniref:Replication protein A 70 kDa DNA-binding subunit B/D first OB fold domain-containing protein n=1 Tax=Crotalaria pallida TaxID=3830 RepID=A0AAN9ED51_CROPI
MDEHYTPIRNLTPALQHAVIRARVVMIWTVPCIRNFNHAFNLHMLLSDSKGDEIQATVCGPHVQFFARSLQESCVYDFAYFGLLRNLGKFRATSHEFRIKFRFYSTFEEIATTNFPPYVLKPNNVDAVFNSDVATSPLMEFYGIITAVSRESYYVHNRERIPVIGLELCDEYGSFDCLILGDFVHHFYTYISATNNAIITVLLKRGKAQECKGRVVIYTVFHVSRLVFNPTMPEVYRFRRRMLHSGFGWSVPMISYAGSKVSIEDQLMGDFPSVCVGLLKTVNKSGYYTLTCYIADICQTTKWYYYECPCKAILRDPSIAMCRICGSTVSKPVPRFRIPIVVADSTASMTLFLLDRYARDVEPKVYRDFMSKLAGSLHRFKVEVSNVSNVCQQTQYFIIRVADHFDQSGVNHLVFDPNCVAFPPPFSITFGSNSELPITRVENKKDFNVGSTNGKGKSPMVPNSIGKVKEGLKRNLNVYHEMCSSGETSKGVKFSKMDFVNGASSSYSTIYNSTRAPE